MSAFVSPTPDTSKGRPADSSAAVAYGRGLSATSEGDGRTNDALPLVHDILDELGPGEGRSVLELGSRYGANLALAARRGWKCFGVEPSRRARDLTRSRYRNQMFVVDQVDSLISHEFDLILLLDVLEHAPDPYALLFGLFSKGAITPQTTVVIRTPNVALRYETASSDERESRPGPGNVISYSAKSLRLLLERLHFTNITITGAKAVSGSAASPESEDLAADPSLAGFSLIVCRASGSDFASFMHERYVPGSWSKLAEYEHMPRYAFARKLCAGAKVLDFGCGTGYGSALLATVASSVVGLDIDEAALRWANEFHQGPRLGFIQRDDLGAGLPDRSFDIVTCFEMIEHVDEPTQIEAVRNFARLLAPGGKLVISTPNPRVTAQYGDNPFHVREMDEEELSRLLSPYFSHIQILKQWIRPSVSIDSQLLPGDDVSFYDSFLSEDDSTHSPVPLAFIAVCSDEEVPNAGRVLYIDSSFDYIRRQVDSDRVISDLRFDSYRLLEHVNSLEEETAKLRAFKSGRVYRLFRTLRGDQPLSGKLRQSAWIIGSMVVPRSIKRRFMPIVRRAQPWAEGVATSVAEPYVVRQPPSPRAERPRVVHAIANFMTGGSARLVVDLVEHLGAEYEQEVITSFLPSRPAYVGLAIREFRHVSSPRPLLAYLSKFRPQLLHIHFWGDVDMHWYRQVFEAGRRYGCVIAENINTPVAPFVADTVRRYVYVSDYVRQEFGRSLPDGQVIYPGSDLQLFSRGSDVRPTDDCIGMVYRLEPDKLSEDSIDVFIEAVRRRARTRVLIVGGGSLQAGFERKVSEAGLATSFEFTGYVRYEDLPALYERMSVFVAPVWRESFGQVSSFAMGMALPVVGYDVGALPEIVDDRELLASLGDSRQLARIIADLLDDPERRAEIGQKNQVRAYEMFSVEAMIDQYRQLYGELTKPSG